MWKNFDGKPYTREHLAAHIAALDFSSWRRKDGTRGRPKFIVLHNTSDPTIALWMSWSPEKRQDYIRNVEQYYENKLHWHAGPHFFVPPDDDICAFGFSDPTTCGTHASCFNSDSIGIEMVGEFNQEAFDDGSGAKVRDNAIHLMALLHNKLGLEPEPYVYGKQGLHFHIECRADNHDCPGKFVHKHDVVELIKTEMVELRGAPALVAESAAPPALDSLAQRVGRLETAIAPAAEIRAAPAPATVPSQVDVARMDKNIAQLGQIAGLLSQYVTGLTSQLPSAAAPTPPLSPIDKALGGQAMVGLKTPLAILAYTGLWTMQAFGAVGTATGTNATTTGKVLTGLITAFGGLGLTAKLDRGIQAVSTLSAAMQKSPTPTPTKSDGAT